MPATITIDHAEKRRRRLAAQSAAGADKVAAIKSYLDSIAPHRRIAALLALIEAEPPAVFWPAFANNWPDCDKGSTYPLLLKVLQRVGPCPASHYQNDGDKGAFFRGLPDQIVVYRGAARERISGLSWTTNPQVAWRFAHRGICDPVVAAGTIAKTDIWWATDRRSEKEIFGEPRGIKIEGLFTLRPYIALIGWCIVHDILGNRHRDRDAWKAKDYALVGLEGLPPPTIVRAHFLAVDRIGYTPEEVRLGEKTEAPADTKYWDAVLAALPAAKSGHNGSHFAAWRDDRDADAYAAAMSDDDFAYYLNKYEED